MVAAAVIHRGEEPPLCGDRGTGNVFFGRCSLQCLFCQNHGISQSERGREVSTRQLAGLLRGFQERDVATVGLVTPTHVTPAVAEALRIARGEGLSVPVVHNGSAVDTPDALARLEGLVDVYLPDLKWGRSVDAERFSGAPWYPGVARTAIRTMAEQVGPLELDSAGVARRGLLVRHLVLPGNAAGSADSLTWLADAVGPCALSLLRQYVPLHHAVGHPVLGRPVTDAEYDEVVDLARWLGFDPIYVQEAGSTELGVPDWDAEEIFDWEG